MVRPPPWDSFWRTYLILSLPACPLARLADQVVQEAHARGIQVLLMTTQDDNRLESERLSTLIERRVSGIIATPTGNNLEIWRKLQGLGAGTVFVDRSIPEMPNADVVKHQQH